MTIAAQRSAPSRIITVGGGKGGVGKSLVALNLAASLACDGYRVVVADLDLGAANQHLLLGLLQPNLGLQSLLDKSVGEAKNCLTPTHVPNLSLLAGTSGVLGAANIPHAQKVSLLRKLRALEADIVVVDVGAGVGYNALDFFDLGVRKLIVTTPQVTALHDAYAFLKSAVLRLLRHSAEDPLDVALLEPATLSTGTEKVVQILSRLRDTRPELADKVFRALDGFGACMVGNQVVQESHAGVFSAVAHTMHEYLGVRVPMLGWLRTSLTIHESVNSRRPLALDPGSKEATAFHNLARAVIATLPAQDQGVGVVAHIATDDEPSAA
jgi:flagellar biosynthesis protein FlhG